MAGLDVLQPGGDWPGGVLFEGVGRRVLEAGQLQVGVAVDGLDQARAVVIGAGGDVAGQGGSLQRGADEQTLAGLQVQADADDQVGVGGQGALVFGGHGSPVGQYSVFSRSEFNAKTRRRKDAK